MNREEGGGGGGGGEMLVTCETNNVLNEFYTNVPFRRKRVSHGYKIHYVETKWTASGEDQLHFL